MFWAVGVLALFCLTIAGLAGQCSFSPGGPTKGPVPTFDAAAALGVDAKELDFPIRNPALPPGWTPNSGNRNDVPGTDGGPSTTVGYVTEGGRFIEMTQTSASEEAVVRAQAPNQPASGAQTVGGVSWIVYPGEKGEPVWVADLGELRVAVRGTANQDEFVKLVQAYMAAKPLN